MHLIRADPALMAMSVAVNDLRVVVHSFQSFQLAKEVYMYECGWACMPAFAHNSLLQTHPPTKLIIFKGNRLELTEERGTNFVSAHYVS